MKYVTMATLAALTLMAATANASLETDIKDIRPLLPKGSDIAQIQTTLLRGSSEADAFDAAKANYLIRDIDGDGLVDILVISEAAPRLENYSTNQPCPSVDSPECGIVYGKRALHLFLGQADGAMRLVFTNAKMIAGGDDGGVFGDPLNGFTVNKKGSIEYAIYGGSAWRWGYTDTLRFRDGNLVVVGQDSYAGWTGDLRADTKSINLITGRVVETHQKNGEAPVRTKIYHVAIKPLVKVSEYEGQNNG